MGDREEALQLHQGANTAGGEVKGQSLTFYLKSTFVVCLNKTLFFPFRTGRVAFDAMGDRLFAEYKVVNIQKTKKENEPQKVVVGNYSYSNVRAKVLNFSEYRLGFSEHQ